MGRAARDTGATRTSDMFAFASERRLHAVLREAGIWDTGATRTSDSARNLASALTHIVAVQPA